MVKGETIRILIVDNDPRLSDVLSRWLSPEGYECVSVEGGEDALRCLGEETFHALFAAALLPRMSGIDLLTIVTRMYPDVAVILITTAGDKQTAVTAVEIGACCCLSKPLQRREVLVYLAHALEWRRLMLVSRNYEDVIESLVLRRTVDLRAREEEILFRLVAATGIRDHESTGHIRRIGLYSALMAEALGWPEPLADDLRLASTMHDVGKIGIPDKIVYKPSALTPEEFEIMKKHTEIGGRILEGSRVPLIQMAREIALYHHERWDGFGYPHGLAGEDIPESARIVGIVDVYDALLNERAYRKAIPEEEAVSIMIVANTQFDPKMFDCFLALVPELRRIREQVEDSHYP